jgi:predicted amino acid-binding ACT domain protein
VFRGNDRVGALTKIFAKLAEAKINVTAAQAVSAGKGRCGAIFWVKPGNAARAAKLLGAK